MNGTEWVILDTETTNRENGECIELATCIGANLFESASLRHYNVKRFKPEVPSAFGALAVHHVLDEELEGRPPSSEALHAVPPASYWIGHNIDFDWEVLGRPTVFRICTLALARKLWPDLDSHSLGAVVYFLFGRTPETREIVKGAHGAAADVRMTEMVLHRILEVTGIGTLSALFAESEDARIPRKWTFGKFEGQPISAADRGYATWFLKNCGDRPDHRYYLTALKRVGLL